MFSTFYEDSEKNQDDLSTQVFYLFIISVKKIKIPIITLTEHFRYTCKDDLNHQTRNIFLQNFVELLITEPGTGGDQFPIALIAT